MHEQVVFSISLFLYLYVSHLLVSSNVMDRKNIVFDASITMKSIYMETR